MNEKFPALRIEAFDSLRAEDEPWLEMCFVPPRDLALMAGSRSVVVFGREGSGKTALYKALRKSCYDQEGKPLRLIADWDPNPLMDLAPEDPATVRSHVAQVFDACAVALVRHLAREPNAEQTLPTWAWDTLTWFIQAYGQGDLGVRLGPQLARENLAVPYAILKASPPEVLGPGTPPQQVAQRLTDVLPSIGLRGVWIMVDGVASWLESDPDRLTTTLVAFFSTLPLFERAHFAYKALLPARLETPLLKAAALVRHRVDGYQLTWDTERLQRLVTRRLELATGESNFELSDLYVEPAELVTWLERAGGESPREWLDQLRPLVSHYISESGSAPVSSETWKMIRSQSYNVPRIYVNEASHQVAVGGRQIPVETLPAKAYEMLVYLYRHGNEIVSKATLYYQAYLGMAHTPRTAADPGYEAPTSYDGLIDTNLWRLRQVIEPDPSNPVLLETVRGHGVRLVSRW